MSWKTMQKMAEGENVYFTNSFALGVSSAGQGPRSSIRSNEKKYVEQQASASQLLRGPAGPEASKNTLGSFRARQSDGKDKHAAKGVFLDAESMKEKVRENLTKRKHNVKDYYKEDGVWTAIATSYWFEVTTLGIIALNSIWIAIDTDLNNAEILLNAHPVFQVAEHFFCLFFFFEWITRYLAFRRKRDCLKDAWFMFDSGLVLMMVSETWVMTAVTLMAGASSGGGAGNTSVLRIARLLRLTRMARMARLLRAMPELMILIKGMLAASRSVVFTLLLLLILMYVFAIAMTQLLAEEDIGKEKFSTVLQSMYTLWLHGTLLDDVTGLQKKLVDDSYVCTAMFFIFVLLAALTVMNMLIGVLCEVVSAVAATEKEEMLVTYVNDKLHNIVKLLDQNGDMKISKSEFMQILENPEACRCLEEVGVDVFGLIDSVDAIFSNTKDWTNQNDEDEQLDFSKFMDVVLQLRGSNNATVKDVVDLKKFVRDAVHHTNIMLMEVQDELKKFREVAGRGDMPRRIDSGLPSRKASTNKDMAEPSRNYSIAKLDEVTLLEETSEPPTPDFLKNAGSENQLNGVLPGDLHSTLLTHHGGQLLEEIVADHIVPLKRNSKAGTSLYPVTGTLLKVELPDNECMIVPLESTPPAMVDAAFNNNNIADNELEEEMIELDFEDLQGSWWPCNGGKKVKVKQSSSCCSSTRPGSEQSLRKRSSSQDPATAVGHHPSHTSTRKDSDSAISFGKVLLPEFDAASSSGGKPRDRCHGGGRPWLDENGFNALDSEDVRLVVARVSQALLIALKDLQVMQRMTPAEQRHDKGEATPLHYVNGSNR